MAKQDWKSLSKAAVRSALGRGAGTGDSSPSATELRHTANRMWTTGEREGALTVLRRARRRFPNDSLLALSYGAKLHQSGSDLAAREALLDCLDLDPANPRALELLADVEGERPVDEELKEAIIESVARRYDGTSKSWPIWFFNLATQEFRSESATNALDRIASESEGLDAEAVRYLRMDQVSRHERVTEVLESAAPNRSDVAALVLCEVVRGANTVALKLIDVHGPGDVPADALRLAARREMRRRRTGIAAQYLRAYLQLNSEDGWATTHLARIEASRENALRRRGANASGDWQTSLAKEYEFSPRTSDRGFDVAPGRVRYFLHNSLPYDSAGYATRTHGILTSLRQLGWEAGGVTRLGYPIDKPGYDPTVAVGDSEIDGVSYQRLLDGVTLPVRKTPVTRFVSEYVEAAERIVRRDRPAVLHAASNHWNGLAVAELARRYDLPSVYEVRGLWELTRASREPGYVNSQHYRSRVAIEAQAANACDRVITITDALAAEMVDRGVPADKITVVPNGVDTSRFSPLERDVELEDKLNLRDRTVIGYVGSVLDYEGIDLLIEAAERISGSREDVAFLIVGDGTAFPEIREQVISSGLEESVILTGRVPHDQVASYYSLIDICPFPRRPLPVCEIVSPLKPFEALAMGKAIIGANVAAISEIIDDGNTGVLFEKGNIDSLEEGLIRLVDDKHLRQSVGAAGLEWVRAERDWAKLGGRVDALYRELNVELPSS